MRIKKIIWKQKNQAKKMFFAILKDSFYNLLNKNDAS